MKNDIVKYLKFGIFQLFLLATSLSGICNDETKNDSVIIELIYDYSLKGYVNHEYKISLDSAEYYLTKALNLQYSTSDYEIDERVANNHIT